MSAPPQPSQPHDPCTEPFDGLPPSAARTRADAMARFEHDAEFFERIVPLFRQAASDQAAALLQAVERGDAPAVQHWAHTLKGSLLTVGATSTAARAAELESAARERRHEGLQARARRLAAEASIIVSNLAATGR